MVTSWNVVIKHTLTLLNQQWVHSSEYTWILRTSGLYGPESLCKYIISYIPALTCFTDHTGGSIYINSEPRRFINGSSAIEWSALDKYKSVKSNSYFGITTRTTRTKCNMKRPTRTNWKVKHRPVFFLDNSGHGDNGTFVKIVVKRWWRERACLFTTRRAIHGLKQTMTLPTHEQRQYPKFILSAKVLFDKAQMSCYLLTPQVHFMTHEKETHNELRNIIRLS